MTQTGQVVQRAILDGVEVPWEQARLAVTDDGAVRGDGAFESVGVWGGRAFRLADHLERLAASLAALRLDPPDRRVLAAAADRLCDGLEHDAMLRFYVTAAGTSLVALLPQPVRPAPRVLIPQPAPWIRPRGTYGPAGAKSMSYAPNMTATRAARAAGGDDALLLAVPEAVVLEGPTFAVCWTAGGVLHAPAVALGIIDSISRRALEEAAANAGIEVRHGAWPLDALLGADEVITVSAVRPATAVQRVGEVRLPAETPVQRRLAAALAATRRG